MANTAAEDIVTMLAADALGTAGTTLFYDKQPDSKPDTAPIAVVYNPGGFDPDAIQGVVFERPTITVRVIGLDGSYAAARALIQGIKTALHTREPETVGGSRYKGIWQQGEVAFVEYDESNRPIFSANFRIHRTN